MGPTCPILCIWITRSVIDFLVSPRLRTSDITSFCIFCKHFHWLIHWKTVSRCQICCCISGIWFNTLRPNVHHFPTTFSNIKKFVDFCFFFFFFLMKCIAKCTIRWPFSVSLLVKIFFHGWEYLLLLSINHMSQPHIGEILELNLVWFFFYDSFS